MGKVEEIIRGTGCYNNVRQGNTVSVTGDGGNASHYFGPAYKKLAPKLVTYLPYAKSCEELKTIKYNILKKKEYIEKREKIEDEYIKSYYEIRLKELDVEKLLKTLEDKFGRNIIFLCHEGINEFCHRRLIADYIELKTGVYIPELMINKEGKEIELEPIRYLEKLKRLEKEK